MWRSIFSGGITKGRLQKRSEPSCDSSHGQREVAITHAFRGRKVSGGDLRQCVDLGAVPIAALGFPGRLRSRLVSGIADDEIPDAYRDRRIGVSAWNLPRSNRKWPPGL